jgi:CRP-like cAMP-binding protein
MDKNQARHAIVSMSALSSLNVGQRSNIADILLEVGKPLRVAANRTLFQRGDPSDDQAYLLIEGEITVEKEGNPGLTAYAPDLIGEMAQMNPARQRTATVTAATDLRVVRFSWGDFIKAASARLTEADLNAFTTALQDHAWRHFTE